MKNERAPRTLADCVFTTGYCVAPPSTRTRWYNVAGTVLAFALIGVLLAWRG